MFSLSTLLLKLHQVFIFHLFIDQKLIREDFSSSVGLLTASWQGCWIILEKVTDRKFLKG